MFKYILGTLLLISSFGAMADSCVEQRIETFRNAHGADAPINWMVMEEFESDCAAGINSAAPEAIKLKIAQAGDTVYIQSMVDFIDVREMRLNRGNCIIWPPTGAPYQLKFGEVKKVTLRYACTAIELELTINGQEYRWDIK